VVAPTLAGGRRVPVFQYHSGTAYSVPGLLARRGVKPVAALSVSILGHLLGAGCLIYLIGRALGFGVAASIAAGTAYQLVIFGVFHLVRRDAYPELVAWAVAPLVLYFGMRLVRSRRRWDRRRWLCLTALALAYFIPSHPAQAAVCGGVVVALLMTYALPDARNGGNGAVSVLAAIGCGVAASAWFWWPLVRDGNRVRPKADAPDDRGSLVWDGMDQGRLGFVGPGGKVEPNAPQLTRLPGHRRVRYWTELKPGRDGLYQLPVYPLPANEVLVNGQPVKMPGSRSDDTTMVPLRTGPNFITIRTKPAVAAWRISLAMCVILAAGALLATIAGRPRPSVSVRHL
jgi:hypothetical protein